MATKLPQDEIDSIAISAAWESFRDEHQAVFKRIREFDAALELILEVAHNHGFTQGALHIINNQIEAQS